MMDLIKENVILKPYTTFKCGGPAKYFSEPTNEEEILSLLEFAKKNCLEVLVLGLGSNVLISDKGFDGLVIHLGKNFSNMELIPCEDDSYVTIKAQSGCALALFGITCAKEGLEGIEFCCGIPGSVGGAVFMNAGAYGGEIKDIVTSVNYIEDGVLKTIQGKDCEFGYRESIFEKLVAEGKTVVVTSFEARLKRGDKEKIMAYVNELKAKRTASQPVDVPSAGSTFKRPVGYYAGALIQESGLKGFKLDESGAQVSPKHAGFVVNNEGKASAADVIALIKYVQDKVFEDNGVRLETEVRLIGGFEE